MEKIALALSIAVSIAATEVPAPAAECGGPLSAPRNLTGRLAGPILQLRWDAPAQGAANKYRIQSGSDSGLADIANFIQDSAATEFDTPVVRNTYFVRVFGVNECGRSPASNEIEITRLSGSRPGLPVPKVQNATRRVTSDFFGDVLVIGEVQNAWGAGMANFVEVNASFFGHNGQFLGSDFTFATGVSRRLSASRLITDTVLPGGESGCFIMFTNIPRSRVARVETSTTFSDFDTEPLEGKVRLVGAFLQEPDFFGDLELNGQLKNVGTKLTYFNRINFDIRRADRQVLDCDFTFVRGSTVFLSVVSTDTGLRPNETGTFRSFSRARFDQVDTVRQWRTWDEDDDLGAGIRAGATAAMVRERSEEYWGETEELAPLHPQTMTHRDRMRLRNRLALEAREIERTTRED